jgi:hypothetical protein
MKNKTYHITFEKGYYKKEVGFRAVKHPTWNLETIDDKSYLFGGKINEGINHLITFENDLIVNGSNLKGQTFGMNFEEFFNAQINGKHLYYQHTENHQIENISGEIKITNTYSNYPLQETRVRISITPKEYINQHWEGNCNRIGGEPIWVQESEKLFCPKCNSEMKFVFQLDSDLPDLNERNNFEIMFGNDGICYGFWCEKDKISGYLWQCT